MMYINNMKEYMSDEEIRRKIRAKKIKQRRRRQAITACAVLLLALVSGMLVGKLAGNLKYKNDKNNAAISNLPIVTTAVNQIGNQGGDKFWSWYGYGSRVEWCACYVSWCESQEGYLKKNLGPKFDGCTEGIAWFKERDQWHEAGETPEAGDIIFFDWEQDDAVDHVGIVTGVVKDKVYAIEGNSSDRCRIKRYKIDDAVILGYGRPETA